MSSRAYTEGDTRSPPHASWLWPGVLVPPLIMLAGMSAQYALVPFACASQSSALLHAISIIALLLSLSSGWLSWRALHNVEEQGREDAGPPERHRFLASCGIGLSAVFSLVIVAQAIIVFAVPACVY
jgi:hypothetical protein